MNIIDFINKSIKIHNDIYDYSLVEYKNMKTKVDIICPVHGIFKQTPNNHLQGYKCKYCKGKLKLTTSEFINRASKKHNNIYDYSLVEYKNMKTKVDIICEKHGIFNQEPRHHLNGTKCPNCSKYKKKTLKQFKSECNKVHSELYDYSLIKKYNSIFDYIDIICPVHGIFNQIANNHLNKKYGCPSCNLSHGEKIIENYLIENNIKYNTQWSFSDCKYKQKLRFDFYLPEKNCLIEFDGIQHFEPVKYFGGEDKFKYYYKLDKIKNEYCYKNNIHLIRIPYNDLNLTKLSQFLKIKE